MTKIVKMQVFNVKKLAGACKRCTDSIRRIWKDALFVVHGFDNPQRFIGQLTPSVVSDFLAWMLHVANQQAGMLNVYVCHLLTNNLILTPCREDSEPDNVLHAR